MCVPSLLHHSQDRPQVSKAVLVHAGVALWCFHQVHHLSHFCLPVCTVDLRGIASRLCVRVTGDMCAGYVCVSMCGMYVYVCMCVRVYVCMCIPIVHVCMCVHVYMYSNCALCMVCVYVCVCVVCVCGVCVCAQNGEG